jgi:RNA polymerase sigma-70 factor (family 1)
MPTQPKYQDNDLFKKLGKGSQEALKEIYVKYSPKLEKFCFTILKDREMSKDIVMVVMQILWERREKVAEMEKPVGWLFTCVERRVLNILENKKRKNTLRLYDENEIPGTEDTEKTMDEQHMSDYIKLAIEKLPAQQKRIVQLKNLGMSRKEIAKECNLSESTVKNQMTYALRKLREIMNEYPGR